MYTIFMKSVLQFTIFSFRDLIILDSDITIHVFNDLSWFLNFKKTSCDDYLFAACSEFSILRYENVILWLKEDKILCLKKVIFCTDFIINLVSFRLLKANRIFWNMINNCQNSGEIHQSVSLISVEKANWLYIE